MKVADALAFTNPPGATFHYNPIPVGYAHVLVDEVVGPYSGLELDIPGGDDEQTLGEAIHRFILWKKDCIIFRSPPTPRLPTPPRSPAPCQQTPTPPSPPIVRPLLLQVRHSVRRPLLLQVRHNLRPLQVRHSFRPLLIVQLSPVSRLRRLSNRRRDTPQLWCVAVRVEVIVQEVQAEASDINMVQTSLLLFLRGLTTGPGSKPMP